MTAAKAEKAIKGAGLRNTARRRRLLDFLSERRAWTAVELHRELKGANLSTIYRNLQKLMKKGLIREIHLKGSEARYEMSAQPHHAHLICRSCGRAECVPCPVKISQEHDLEISGICQKCRRSK
jgi:Fe2+ or Zn2+ uptake regulation protein